ncbi:hypothetical protein P8625_11280 [Tenacibaculum tangerinum]|uniref:Tetratricopeptide repeat protein n=1 Tax=Tenacibaculum tangerinum TaxID=3038772 RepID=A0ABY8KZL5_9FLAO|nr:hypothetical protein [Tenacibaculum tangerinum]WGH74667.1 hypothetical protein P8625_11280 [Tenacibaculum tangerinum]
MHRLVNTDAVAYKTFAYTAIEYLKTREKQPVDIAFFKDSITKYLPKIGKTPENDTILFDIHIILGNTNKRRGLMKSALLHYIKAENYAIKAKDIERIIKIKGNIALIYQDINELNEAIYKMKQKDSILEENKERLGAKYLIHKNKTSLNIGAIYATLYKSDTGKYNYADSSMYYYNSVLNNNKYKENSYNLGRVYYSLGTLYSLKKDYTKGNLFLEKSLKIFEENKLQSHLYKGYYNIGVNYYMVNDFKNAKNSFLEALNIKNDTLLDYNYINIHNFLAKIYSNEKKSDSAAYYLNVFLNAYNRISERERQEFKDIYKIDKEVDFNKKINTLNTNISKKSYYYNIAVISLIISLILIIFLVVKNKNEKKKAKKRLEELLIKVSKKEKDFSTISMNTIKIRTEK